MATTTQTRDALIHDIDKLKNNASQVAQDLRNHASAHLDERRHQIESVRDNLVARPFTLLGIGFGVGLLLGLRLRS